MNKYTAVIFLLFISFALKAQETATIYGKILDTEKRPVEAANIAIIGTTIGAVSNESGNYELTIPANKSIILAISHLGHTSFRKEITLSSGERFQFDPILQIDVRQIGEVQIEAEQKRHSPMRKLDPKIIKQIPSTSGSFETILFSQPGVVSNNELSSQYSVRGGNFDENLVYVNDIEIYRPFLIRSGQQEGLSFINSDLVQDVQFSAGGFEAKYGDKMSSVLDITYKEPTKFSGSVAGSLLGGSVHVENASKDHRFTQIHGYRYRTNRYVLNSLNTQGQYQPSFMDYQGYITYDLADNLEIGFLGNISSNKYNFIPESQETKFGNINQGLKLTVFFDGQEVDEFNTYLGAFSTHYKPRNNVSLKLIASAYKTVEKETYDILGQYWLDELERDLSSEDFGEVAFNRGVGTFLNHGRNYLDALIYNVSHKGAWYKGKTTILWGARFQQERIQDELNQWVMLDSSGYSIPQSPSNEIWLSEAYRSTNNVNTTRITDYVQANKLWELKDTSQFIASAGLRTHYWSYNQDLLISPRITMSYEPNWEKDFLFRASWGYYYQPPFYREYRAFNGELNPNIEAQQSIHYVLGSDYNFTMWGRPFKMVNEIYYKQLNNLVPYEIDNVRIRYYAENNADGFAYGLDTKINGEFVKGVESWASISIMNIQEDLRNDSYLEYYDDEGNKVYPAYQGRSVIADSATIYPGAIPRPTDQRVTFGLFFQDYLPNRPQYKMHLNLLYGSGLPTGPPSFERYKDTLRLPAYRRVDIGFSYSLLDKKKDRPAKHIANKLKDVWLSIEVFNLLQVSNTISYLWIKDVSGRLYAVPNHLTSRRLNVKLQIKF